MDHQSVSLVFFDHSTSLSILCGTRRRNQRLLQQLCTIRFQSSPSHLCFCKSSPPDRSNSRSSQENIDKKSLFLIQSKLRDLNTLRERSRITHPKLTELTVVARTARNLSAFWCAGDFVIAQPVPPNFVSFCRKILFEAQGCSEITGTAILCAAV